MESEFSHRVYSGNHRPSRSIILFQGFESAKCWIVSSLTVHYPVRWSWTMGQNFRNRQLSMNGRVGMV